MDYLANSTVDTAGIRAAYRALPLGSPDTDHHSGPASAVLAVAREVPGLCDEVDRLARLLGQARYAYANLAAAARAALSAHNDGETDPWWYLRDELGGSHPDHGTGPDPIAPVDHPLQDELGPHPDPAAVPGTSDGWRQ